MDTNQIYMAAKERGLTPSRRQFSREFLGRAPNYLADTGSSRCSTGALLNLYKRLGELGQADLQALAFARLLHAETRGDGAAAVRP